MDRPWLKYYTEKDLAIEVPRCTVYRNIWESNKDHLEDVAILYYGNRIRYGTLFSNVEACAKSLRQVGIGRGDCVTLCSAGVPEAVYLVLACSRIGAIANFVNPLFPKGQMLDRINETEAEWIFVLDAMYPYVEDALPETRIRNAVIIPATTSTPMPLSKLLYLRGDARKIVGKGNGRQRFSGWKDFTKLGRGFQGSPDLPYEPDSPAIMVYSSGSTGASKGILLTNDGINATVANYLNSGFTFERGDSFLQMIPVWFSTGIVLSMLMPLIYGVTVIPEPKFSKETFVADLVKHKPSMTLTATSLWLYAINAEEMRGADLSRMEYAITGGEKVLPKDEEKINAFLREHGCGHKLYKGYGMCELGGTISTTTGCQGYSDKPGGCGYPILNSVVSSFDIVTGDELPYGQRGELRVLSRARMKGYYKNPQATAEFFKADEDGNAWGCTGDIGYVDEDGEVFVLGRATDCCRLDGGEVVFLFDVEDAVLRDAAVRQCKVVDVEGPEGVRLVAHVVFRDGVSDVGEALGRIHRMLVETLPPHMVPHCYKARSAMPVHANGKRDVGALREDRENLVRADQLR